MQEKLLRATVNKRKTVDQEKTFAALLNELSKAFDCFSHDLIIANLMLMDLFYGLIPTFLRYVRKQDRNQMRFPELPLTWTFQNDVYC